MSGVLADRVGVASATSGTGTLTLGAAVAATDIIFRAPFLTFANGGIATGQQVSYLILDSNGNWETGLGTYTLSGLTLSRDVVTNGSSGAGSKITCSGNEQVFITLRKEDMPQQPSLASGVLTVSSTTQINFGPKNGNLIQIAGNYFQIPGAGITANNTSVFVNGVAAQNLAASTLYYVYVFNNSGTPTINFSSTTGHVVDTTAGNVGVEIMSGDNTQSFVGLIRTDAASHFQDSGSQRFCASWFNRLNKGLISTPANTTTTSITPADVSGGSILELLVLQGEGSACSVMSNASNSSPGSFGLIRGGLDGTTGITGQVFTFVLAANAGTISATGFNNLSEGYHTYGLTAQSSVGTNTFSLNNNTVVGMIRG